MKDTIRMIKIREMIKRKRRKVKLKNRIRKAHLNQKPLSKVRDKQKKELVKQMRVLDKQKMDLEKRMRDQRRVMRIVKLMKEVQKRKRKALHKESLVIVKKVRAKMMKIKALVNKRVQKMKALMIVVAVLIKVAAVRNNHR